MSYLLKRESFTFRIKREKANEFMYALLVNVHGVGRGFRMIRSRVAIFPLIIQLVRVSMNVFA